MSENSIMTLADFNISDMSPETITAIDTHEKIMKAEYTAAEAMLTLCENLKKMRDKQLYKPLGFESFEDYTERACNIKKRQAYNYIQTYERLGGQFLQSNAQLGITKLQLLTEICAVDREDFVNENDLEGLSVAEIKKLIAENKEQGEQLSLLSDEAEAVKRKSDQRISEQYEIIEQLRRENSELRSRPVEVAVREPSAEDLEKAVAEKTQALRAELEAESKARIKEAREKAAEKAQKNNQKAINEAITAAKQEIEAKYREQIASAEAEKSEARKRAEEIAAKLDKNADADLVTASVYFGEVQKQLDAFIKASVKVEAADPEKGKKLKKLAADFLKKIIAQFEEG